MAEPVGDLVVDLSLDAARFDEQMARVRRHFSGTETDAKKTAAVVEQSLSRQALAAQKAGISVGQYKAAMRMLPAQFTDVATQLAGGQSPWLILLQQGGQVKDSFGGMIPMFRGLAGAITLPMVGATSLAVATGALAYAWYQGNSTLSDFNKTLVLSGNQAGLTADRMLVLSRAGQAAGLTFNQTSESLTALVNAGVRGGEQFEAISQSVARFSSASGVEVDKVAEAFGKLTTDPTSGLTAMARQFHNVTAEQIAYVAQLQRSGDEAGALQAANEAATKGFDDQTRRLKENMGTLETWADRTARAFKSMWDSVLDIGRPDTAQGMLEKAEKAFDEADKKWQWYQSRSHRRGKTSAFLANLRGAWEDRANAQLGLSAATLQADLEKAREMAAKDWAESEASRLKYTEEAQKAYERLQTPLEKYTARQEELNKALKDGKILQADYNTLMAAAKKDYEATLKKPKQSGVKVSAGDRQEDSAHAALLTLQAELRTLEKHAGANEKISQQRRDLWKAESQFAVLEEAAQRRQLSAQEKSLLAHKDETLEYKRQLAALGDKVTYQERLNALAQQADKFAQQQRAKRAAIDAKSRGLTDRQAEREATEQRLKEQYGDNPLALNNVMSEQKKTWAAEDQLRGSWMAGLKSGWSEWEESATDSMSQVKSAATQTFDGIAQNMAAMLTGSEQNWRSFTRSVLSMMTEILLKQAMVGIVGSIGSAIGGAVGGGASASGGTAIQAAAAKFHFATGGFTGTGGKYEPAGIVHRGEFVFTKEATSRIGVGNLYRLMRGYAEGGYVGGAGSPAQMRRAEGINFNQNNHVVIQNDGTNGLPGPQMMKAVYDMARKGNGAHFDGDQSGTVNGVTPPAVQYLTAEVTADSGEYQVLARWDTPKVVKGVSFMLRLTVAADDGSERLVSTARTTETTYRFTQLALGNYRLTVRAVNAWGQQGDPASVSFRIAAPAAPSRIELTPGYFQITATPHLAVYDPTVQFEFWFSEKRIADIRQVETTARYLGTALYWIAASINIRPGHNYYFYVRSVNTVGKSAFVEAVGQPSDDASGYLDFFKGEIGKTHLAQELWTQIDNGQLAPDLAEIRTSITDVSNEITQTVNKKLEDQSAAIQQIQKVQVDTNNNLNSMWAVKLQQMQDGRLYIAGIGAGIENTPDGMQSQVLLAADRIAMINPANGNTKPMFVGQGDQIFMNEVFLKYLTAPTITSGGNPPAFSLTPDGKLTAKNADISGSVNANSGTLNNVTINENCQIKGKLSANQIEGDIVKTVGKAFPRDSRAPERWPSGTITVRIYDDQPFDRQIVIPAVAFCGAKHERENNDIYSSCRLIVKKNGAEIYNRTALDNTLIYSGVIDMPAGHGHMTLEFSVSAWLVNDWYPTASISDLLVVVMKKATAGISIS
ncbi:phage tail tape measure protein [Escherichia coli]